MGNSEVGHLTIGSGRVLFQDLMRVNLAVRDGSIFENAALSSAFARARERGGDVHLLGLVSTGGVHSHLDHLLALLELARREGMARANVDPRVHRRPRRLAARRRRSTSPACPPTGSRRSSGRYYAMDRDNRAERTERAVAAILDGRGRAGGRPGGGGRRRATSAATTDEFIEPIVVRGPAAPRSRRRRGDLLQLPPRPRPPALARGCSSAGST